MFGLTESSFNECVKPELKSKWKNEIEPSWFAGNDERRQKQPGLLKPEATLTNGIFVGLSSKVLKCFSKCKLI